MSDRGAAPADVAAGPLWQRLFAGLPQRLGRQPAPVGAEAALSLAERLVVESGEAQAVRLADDLAEAIRRLDEPQLLEFFLELIGRFGADEAALRAAARLYADDPSQERATALHAAAEPRREELLKRLNMASGGTALIVRLREQVLRMAKTRPGLAPLEADLHRLLASWFNRGFLKLERIDWDSPAALLESVIRYEAVHEIRDWASLRSRLRGNRRCLGFFHPAMPGIPLIFVEVALTTEMSAAITPLLAAADSEASLERPTNAVFYSINNCHVGLKGISLGDLLIKQVVQELRTEFPSLKHFATLSPIPGFARWLAGRKDVPQAVAETLATEGWHRDAERAEAIRAQLMALCAQYLTGASPDGGDGKVSDPVARFHLTNGARLEQINWLADQSPKGLAESHGLMVNYRYLPNAIEANHRAFVEHGQVSTSSAVAQLLGGGQIGSWLKPIGFGAPRRAAGRDSGGKA
jgi:malonyl-CoA decarboxylase